MGVTGQDRTRWISLRGSITQGHLADDEIEAVYGYLVACELAGLRETKPLSCCGTGDKLKYG